MSNLELIQELTDLNQRQAQKIKWLVFGYVIQFCGGGAIALSLLNKWIG